MRITQLRWFEHVNRRCVDAPLRRWEWLVIKGTRRARCRLKKEE